MGIEKLNTLLANATHYEGKFRTIIIDGSNMLITFISAIVSGIKRENNYAPWSTFNQDIVRILYEIINQSTDRILTNLNIIKKTLLDKKGEIIFVIDSSEEPKYITNDNRVLYLKSDERKIRKQKQDRSKTINEQLEKIKLEYGYFIGKECLNESVLTNLFLQLDYFNNVGNYIKLMPLIINNIANNVEKVRFIQAISEADFVIKNLANTHNKRPVLVMSEDTDYFLLLSDIKRAYKTSIKVKQPIYYPYKFWKEIIGCDIGYNELIYITTLIGNDYVSHKSYLTMDAKNGEKNINRIKGLCNIDNHLHDDIKSSRLKKIKMITQNFNPESISTVEDFRRIFDNLDQEYKNAIAIYESWMLNFEYKNLEYNEITFNNLLEELLKKYSQRFKFIISFDKYNLNNIINNTFNNNVVNVMSWVKNLVNKSDFDEKHLIKYKLELWCIIHQIQSKIQNKIENEKLQIIKNKIQDINSKEEFLNIDLEMDDDFTYIIDLKKYYDEIYKEKHICYLED